MPDYSKGKIYSIRSHLTDDVYIGSTIETLAKRLYKHKMYYKQWLITKKLYTTSFKIIEKDAECYIELIELYPCNSKIELCKREGEIIRDTTCVNKNIAGRTQKEYIQDNKAKIAENKKQYSQNNKEQIAEKQKQWYENNKEQIIERTKQWYENNKQQIAEKSKIYRKNNKQQLLEKEKQYRQTNKQQLLEKAKQYRQTNKQSIIEQKKQYYNNNKAEIREKVNQKYTCECGSTPTITHKSRHIKTKKHQTFINSSN